MHENVDIYKDGNQIVFKRVTKKGDRKVMLAHVIGHDVAMRRPEYVFMEATDSHFLPGKHSGFQEKFTLEADEIYMCGQKGEQKTFFTVNSKGIALTLTRRQVYEYHQIPWEEDYTPMGSD